MSDNFRRRRWIREISDVKTLVFKLPSRVPSKFEMEVIEHKDGDVHFTAQEFDKLCYLVGLAARGSDTIPGVLKICQEKMAEQVRIKRDHERIKI